MSVEVKPPDGDGAQRVTDSINRIAASIARHWLLLFNIVVAVFVGLPILAPVLMDAGATGAANLIYKIYSPTCHQLPERSVFLYGNQHFHSRQELESEGHIPAGLNTLQRQALRWQGSLETGWKIALCQRDLAIYGSMLLAGLAFGVARPALRRRVPSDGRWPKMPIWLFALFIVPIAVDGLSQLVGLRESVPALRFFTGALMGAAAVWFAYPYVEEAMRDIAKNTPGRAKA